MYKHVISVDLLNLECNNDRYGKKIVTSHISITIAKQNGSQTFDTGIVCINLYSRSNVFNEFY